jgi:hemoglobin
MRRAISLCLGPVLLTALLSIPAGRVFGSGERLLARRALHDPDTPAQAPAPSLYKRLGGYDALAAVTDDFIGRLLADPQITRFFVGQSDNSKARIRQLVVDQLCHVTGGPCVYIGRDMKTVHAGLGITEKDWDASVKHLVATLDKFKVPAREKDEVLAAVSTLKKDIVEKP